MNDVKKDGTMDKYVNAKIGETSRNETLTKNSKTIENMVEMDSVCKTYEDGRIMALDGVDLKVRRGEFVSVMGPSGSGKSTLLNLMGALDTADEGRITVAGHDLTQREDFSTIRSAEIGFIFQFHNLIPNLTASENVQIPMLETPLSDEKMVQRAEDLLKSLNMENKLDQIPTKLSGGERQRVAIARALANHPSLILADEPTGSLDSKTGKIILDILRDIHRRDGVTIVMVTHDERVAEAADRIIQVSAGRIEV